MSKEWTYGLVHQGDFREIEKDEVVVGRSRTCDIRIGEPSVSRKHFRLLVADGVITVQDLGSSNGTYVNDEVVQDRQDLAHGDRVTIGDIDVFAHIEAKADTRPFVGLETRMLNSDELLDLQSNPPGETPPPPEGVDEHETPVKPNPIPSPPAADTWPIDESPTPGEIDAAALEAHQAEFAPMATHRFGPDELAEMQPASTRDAMPIPAATQRIDLEEIGDLSSPQEPTPDPHGTRLIEHDFGEVAQPGPGNLWRPPPPPSSMTPPIESVPVPDVPGIPTLPAEESGPAVETDLDATDVPVRTGSPQPRPSNGPSAPPSTAPEAHKPLGIPDSPLSRGPAGLDDIPLAGHNRDVGPLDAGERGIDGDLLGSAEGFEQTQIGMPNSGTDPQAPAVSIPSPSTPPAPAPVLRERSGVHARPPAAGFWIRLMAAVAEAAWAGALGFGLSRILGTADDPITRQSAYALAFGFVVLVVMIGWSVWGTTPGKRLFRLYVCTATGQPGIGALRSLVRAVGYLVSFLTLGIGFLLAASNTRRALHDRIAGTYVARLR